MVEGWEALLNQAQRHAWDTEKAPSAWGTDGEDRDSHAPPLTLAHTWPVSSWEQHLPRAR